MKDWSNKWKTPLKSRKMNRKRFSVKTKQDKLYEKWNSFVECRTIQNFICKTFGYKLLVVSRIKDAQPHLTYRPITGAWAKTKGRTIEAEPTAQVLNHHKSPNHRRWTNLQQLVNQYKKSNHWDRTNRPQVLNQHKRSNHRALTQMLSQIEVGPTSQVLNQNKMPNHRGQTNLQHVLNQHKRPNHRVGRRCWINTKGQTITVGPTSNRCWTNTKDQTTKVGPTSNTRLNQHKRSNHRGQTNLPRVPSQNKKPTEVRPTSHRCWSSTTGPTIGVGLNKCFYLRSAQNLAHSSRHKNW